MRAPVFAVLAAAFQLMAADPRLGTWKLVSASSTQDPPRTYTVTPEGNGIHFVNSPNRMEFTGRYDGRPYPLLNVRVFDQVALHRTSGDAIEQVYTKDGTVIETDRMSFSSNRNEVIETNSFISPRGPDVVWIWERTGGSRNPADPYIGEWTRNLSKSRMRQGLVLRIEPDGGDGVHFVGEFSYTAKPDGMDYPVKAARFADATALEFVDARTVISVYKLAGKVTGQDRCVVSGDGKRMSVASDRTQRNGIRTHEDLVFEKQ